MTHLNNLKDALNEVYLSSKCCMKCDYDSRASNMFLSMDMNAYRPSPNTLNTSRTPTSIPQLFKSSGSTRIMILFGLAFRNPYLFQCSSTRA